MFPARLLAAFCVLLFSASAWASTLFGVFTERTAPLALQAARQHLATHPADRIVLRTTAQLMRANERELRQWLSSADSVFAVAVFGDPARRLKDAIARYARSDARIMSFNGEQSLSLLTRDARGTLENFPPDILRQLSAESPPASALSTAEASPAARAWLAARQSWQAGGAHNIAALIGHLLHPEQALPPPRPEAALRLRVDGADVDKAALPSGPTLVVLDLSTADPSSADALCLQSKRSGLPCVAMLTRWGGASREAIEHLPELIAPAALIVLQDFVIGAAEGREAVTQALARLNVPVFKAIRLTERSALQWRLSPDGLPPDSVQYRVALPELQGTGQPVVVAVAGGVRTDRATGIEVRHPEILHQESARLVARAVRWQKLARMANRDKRVAIVYYNHPPGRQNIGADNLDVPASLFDMLHALKAAGYTVGELPASPQALLGRIMDRGVNLPEDQTALRDMALRVDGVDERAYARWFDRLPPRVRGEMRDGPLGRLHAEALEAERAGERALGRKRIESALKELHHLAEGADHPRRADAIRWLRQLERGYAACLIDTPLADRPPRSCATLAPLRQRLLALDIEGLRGWGAPPGRVMVSGERLLVPGLRFGNVFIGPQPPRGWEVDEELLHANTSVPPPHQYLAFYHWLRDVFRADAVIHLGRHSTYEFLPGKAVGLSGDDYPSLIASDLPGIYPYIVDGVGEGTQAKRRGLAVIVDHLVRMREGRLRMLVVR